MQAAALAGAGKGKGCELCIITLDQKDMLVEQGLTIRVVPAWEWLD